MDHQVFFFRNKLPTCQSTYDLCSRDLLIFAGNTIDLDYLQITFDQANATQQELLIAVLNEYGAEGFEETATGLKAFFPPAAADQASLSLLLNDYGIPYSMTTLAQQNWNQQWEEQFQPVIIGDFCRIRAHFHPAGSPVQHDIIITPKMSFGTGHHATTRLMVEQMAGLPFKDARVFDFGTGTGVLAILAEQLGAAAVLAIDNDEWSFTNATENIAMNHCVNTRLQLATLDELSRAEQFNIILANINRHILLAGMNHMAALLAPQGILLMSGLLQEDADLVTEAAIAAGLKQVRVIPGNAGWIGISCHK